MTVWLTMEEWGIMRLHERLPESRHTNNLRLCYRVRVEKL